MSDSGPQRDRLPLWILLETASSLHQPHRPLMAASPEYYAYSQIMCIFFVLQAVAWLLRDATALEYWLCLVCVSMGGPVDLIPSVHSTTIRQHHTVLARYCDVWMRGGLRNPDGTARCISWSVTANMKVCMTENDKLVVSYRSSKRLDRKNRDSRRDIMVVVSGVVK